MGEVSPSSIVLDPFSGTATTGLVAAEKGASAHCFDINPFLVWFGRAKCGVYSEADIANLKAGVGEALEGIQEVLGADNWVPSIYNISRWWCPQTLKILAAFRRTLAQIFGEPGAGGVSEVAWVVFCRLAIETSAAAFNHVSMSFQEDVKTFELRQIKALCLEVITSVSKSAEGVLEGESLVYFADSKGKVGVEGVEYSHVITSPPYPNRVSYIRELRPYMYWTKFLKEAREAGEMDWGAIGGTWGVATSRLKDWNPTAEELPATVELTVAGVRETEGANAALMANYVWKYLHDMHLHVKNLRGSLAKGARLSYIVGNSSFYGAQVRTERLLEDSLKKCGFVNVESAVVRKRNSKKELFEYCVNATWEGFK